MEKVRRRWEKNRIFFEDGAEGVALPGRLWPIFHDNAIPFVAL